MVRKLTPRKSCERRFFRRVRARIFAIEAKNAEPMATVVKLTSIMCPTAYSKMKLFSFLQTTSTVVTWALYI